jgi:hypothetical protein
MKEPNKPASPMSDVQFCIICAVMGCLLAATGVFLDMPLLMVLGIMLPAFASVFRGKPPNI